jgi:deoxycytidylate deaminase
VRDTFPKSDFFLRIDSKINSLIERKVKRFLDLILQTRVITPWASETAMYLAASAAGNSACLSRQVGAALTDEKDEVISVGWNDVPKFKGGLYMSADSLSEDKDQRCWNLEGGICFNDKEKHDRAELLVGDLIKAKIITEEQRGSALEKVKGSSLKSLIEFSRAIHAEMHAIILGSQVGGARVRGGKLYCTTYPCHSCARHIVVSGVKEVYYIEPYRKSLAIKLHSDAISESETDVEKVRILPYDGVSPSRYLKLFRVDHDARKTKEGKLPIINPRKAQPKFLKTMEALPVLESIVVTSLKAKNLIPNEDEI